MHRVAIWYLKSNQLAIVQLQWLVVAWRPDKGCNHRSRGYTNSLPFSPNKKGKGLATPNFFGFLHLNLDSLKTPCMDIFYLHAPDHNTPLEETLGGVQQLYEGKGS